MHARARHTTKQRCAVQKSVRRTTKAGAAAAESVSVVLAQLRSLPRTERCQLCRGDHFTDLIDVDVGSLSRYLRASDAQPDRRVPTTEHDRVLATDTHLAFHRPSLTEDMNIVMPLTFGSGTAVTCTASRNTIPALYCRGSRRRHSDVHRFSAA